MVPLSGQEFPAQVSHSIPGIDVGGETIVMSLVVEDGRITRIYAMRNPQKLGWLEKVSELRR